MLKNKILASSLASLLMAATLLFTSCVPENVSPDADLPKGAVLLNAPDYKAVNSSKLGVDTDGKDLFFAEGDVLWVNGFSCPISVNASGQAYFLRPDGADFPLRIVYPYSIVDPTYTYDYTDNIPITLPAEYTYATVQSGPGARRQSVPAPLCAKITSAAEASASSEAFFHHIASAITVAIRNKTGAPMELEKIAIQGTQFLLNTSPASALLDVASAEVDIYGGSFSPSSAMYKTVLNFTDGACRVENGQVAYVQIPVLQQFRSDADDLKTKLKIGVLAKNKLPNVIANKFYFEKEQPSENFQIKKGQLAYAPADFDIDMESTNPNYGLLVDGTYTIGTDASGKKLKVYFAQGNLVYATGTPGPDNTYDDSKWSFAPYQYTTHESIPVGNNGYNTHSETGFTTLFLYSATGHDRDVATSHHPQYGPGGISSGHYAANLSRDNETDWGVRMGDKWFTLSEAQWRYLIEHNQRSVGKYNDIRGVHIYPDKFGELGAFVGTPFKANRISSMTNNETLDDWTKLGNAGVLFLPCAGILQYGYSDGRYILSTAFASYWTSTWGTDGAVGVQLQPTGSGNSTNVTKSYPPCMNTSTASDNNVKAKSRAVRLVYPANF